VGVGRSTVSGVAMHFEHSLRMLCLSFIDGTNKMWPLNEVWNAESICKGDACILPRYVHTLLFWHFYVLRTVAYFVLSYYIFFEYKAFLINFLLVLRNSKSRHNINYLTDDNSAASHASSADCSRRRRTRRRARRRRSAVAVFIMRDHRWR